MGMMCESEMERLTRGSHYAVLQTPFQVKAINHRTFCSPLSGNGGPTVPVLLCVFDVFTIVSRM